MIEVMLGKQVPTAEKVKKYHDDIDPDSESKVPILSLVEKVARPGDLPRNIFLTLDEIIVEDILDEITSEAVADESLNIACHVLGLKDLKILYFLLSAEDLCDDHTRYIRTTAVAKQPEHEDPITINWSMQNALFFAYAYGIPLMVEDNFFEKFGAITKLDKIAYLKSLPVSQFGNYKITIVPPNPSSL